MGVFTKKIGPTFLKKGNSAEEYIRKLEELKAEATGEVKKEIEAQLAMAKYGLIGEQKIAYELKNSGIDMYILQDVYLEHNELSAQIDYVVITEKHIYIIECKNLIGSIEVNNSGEFIRSFEVGGRKIKQRIYSPIEQNERHLRRINELYESTQRNSIIKKLFEDSIDNRCKTLVVLANPETMLYAKYAKKEIKEQIVHIDLLIKRIKEIDAKSGKKMDVKEMYKLAEFFQSTDNVNRPSYVDKYEKLVAKIQDEASQRREKLIRELKSFRLEQSRLEKRKPYYIFNDAQMEDIIHKNPQNKEELKNVSGFGEIKAQKYGDAILRILQSGSR